MLFTVKAVVLLVAPAAFAVATWLLSRVTDVELLTAPLVVALTTSSTLNVSPTVYPAVLSKDTDSKFILSLLTASSPVNFAPCANRAPDDPYRLTVVPDAELDIAIVSGCTVPDSARSNFKLKSVLNDP